MEQVSLFPPLQTETRRARKSDPFDKSCMINIYWIDMGDICLPLFPSYYHILSPISHLSGPLHDLAVNWSTHSHFHMSISDLIQRNEGKW